MALSVRLRQIGGYPVIFAGRRLCCLLWMFSYQRPHKSALWQTGGGVPDRGDQKYIPCVGMPLRLRQYGRGSQRGSPQRQYKVLWLCDQRSASLCAKRFDRSAFWKADSDPTNRSAERRLCSLGMQMRLRKHHRNQKLTFDRWKEKILRMCEEKHLRE